MRIVHCIATIDLVQCTYHSRTVHTYSPSPLLRRVQNDFSNNARLRGTPAMTNVSLNNIPLHARPINECLRYIRRERTVQHRLEPDPFAI